VAQPDVLIEVRGHADASGPELGNLLLTQRRADVVVAYLATRGVAAWRMSAVALGSGEPIADNGTDAGRAANRRSEVVVKDGR
jgi:outer membrane protein OmpA-like peptidoglycan-associated protein